MLKISLTLRIEARKALNREGARKNEFLARFVTKQENIKNKRAFKQIIILKEKDDCNYLSHLSYQSQTSLKN
jgi:hypothetical protein